MQKMENPHFFETDELWSSYLDTWKALGQGYETPEICGPKFKNGGDMARGAKNRTPPLSQN